VRGFRRLVDPVRKSLQADFLFSVKNAREIWEGKLPPTALGVTALDPDTLQFVFSQEDPEFEMKLIQPALTPWPEKGRDDSRENAAQMNYNGPYRITSWKKGQVVTLSPNPNYGLKAAAKRPNLEALMVEADSTALRLYEDGKLSFLRRLPAREIARFKASPEFHQVPMARFDYVGFGPQLAAHENLRAALASSLDFHSFQVLFDALGPPGCPSLPARLMDRLPCLKPDYKKARERLAMVKDPPKLELHFSQLGGDDIARAAEWFQGQWKKNLKLEIPLAGEEQAVYLRRLRTSPPPVFRKGVSLDRPTCLAGLEIFKSDSPENYIGFHDPSFDGLLKTLSRAKTPGAKKKLCRQGVERLLASWRMIPLGQMYFSILAKADYQGWDLNELNQLDLTELTLVQSSPASR
jgi:oligopeptide transport system substrate-binding protein